MRHQPIHTVLPHTLILDALPRKLRRTSEPHFRHMCQRGNLHPCLAEVRPCDFLVAFVSCFLEAGDRFCIDVYVTSVDDYTRVVEHSLVTYSTPHHGFWRRDLDDSIAPVNSPHLRSPDIGWHHPSIRCGYNSSLRIQTTNADGNVAIFVNNPSPKAEDRQGYRTVSRMRLMSFGRGVGEELRIVNA